MYSHSRALENELTLLLSESTTITPKTSYLLISATLTSQDFDFDEQAKDLLKISKDTVVYYTSNKFFILLPPTNESHFLEGKHHSLCSYFSNFFWRCSGSDVEIQIIELRTKIEVLVYFGSKIVSCYYSTVSELTEKDTEGLLYSECKKLLSDIPPEKKKKEKLYGRFMRKKVKKGKTGYATLSKMYDSRNLNTFSNFIFESQAT